MTRLYGRAPRGRRLFAKAPFGHWKTSSKPCSAKTRSAPEMTSGAASVTCSTASAQTECASYFQAAGYGALY